MNTRPVLAIDPGPERSGWVLFDGRRVRRGSPDEDNGSLLDLSITETVFGRTPVAIEWIQSYGMAVGRDVFETCYWVGRFAQAVHDVDVTRIPRRDIKLHLCGTARARDTNVRQALIDRFGGSGGRKAAVGTKAAPGPLYGVKSHMWSALALAVTYWDQYVASDTGDDVDSVDSTAS